MPEQEEVVKKLERLRERRLLEISRLREELRAGIEPAATGDEDLADAATDMYERTKIISLIKSQQSRLQALEHAIGLAKKGIYGICEMCGEPIPEERLEIVPETTLCVRCASKMEEGMRHHHLRTRGTVRPRR